MRTIKNSTLPLELTDSASIDKARVLFASGMIEANISAPEDPVQKAIIFNLTNLGLIATHVGENPNEL
ncbi:hypothetical protein [Diaphorobacter caeni]|uniref:hypothetical protein n=1 Tax=Diaphorobacter caeni TaxID=2784387 RepID=UPI00188E16C5|nr:hypothetical protein [Diaphorobacter caeni]MBF5006824.1 hypothetical protein [Diaphorobacter caeni]